MCLLEGAFLCWLSGVKCQLIVCQIVKLYVFLFNRMLMFRFWGRLRSVSTPTSPSWTVRNNLPWKLYLRETWTIPWLLTKHLGSVCVTMTHQYTTHLIHNTHTVHAQTTKQHTLQLPYTHTQNVFCLPVKCTVTH